MREDNVSGRGRKGAANLRWGPFHALDWQRQGSVIARTDRVSGLERPLASRQPIPLGWMSWAGIGGAGDHCFVALVVIGVEQRGQLVL